MSACLVCGSERFHAALPRVGPAVPHHRQAIRRGALRRVRAGAARSAARRPRNCAATIPDNYWFAPDESAASRLEEAYRRLVLRDHVRFVEQALREFARARAAARRGLRRRTVSRADAGARIPRGGAGLFARGGGDRLAAAAGAGRGRAMLETRPLARRESRRHHHVPRAGASLRSARLPARRRANCWRRTAAWWCRCRTRRPGSSACWGARGTAWMCRATCSIFATATWRRLLEALRLRSGAAQIFLAARQSGGPGEQPGARRSTRWRGACGGSRESARRAAGQGPGVLRAGGGVAAVHGCWKRPSAPAPP